MSFFYLEKRISALNQKRFYTIAVTPTLFDSWAVHPGMGPDGASGHGAGDGV